jgi:hypothetical protein
MWMLYVVASHQHRPLLHLPAGNETVHNICVSKARIHGTRALRANRGEEEREGRERERERGREGERERGRQGGNTHRHVQGSAFTNFSTSSRVASNRNTAPVGGDRGPPFSSLPEAL